MSKLNSTIVGFLLLCFAGISHAIIIDFDDLNSGSGTFIPQGYHGFSWGGGFGPNSWVNNAGSSIGSSAHSGTNFAWSNGGTALELTDGLFDVDSLWLMSKFGGSSTPTVTFRGFLNNNEIFNYSALVNDQSWTQLNLNFSGIDKLWFDGVPNTNLLVDDISYSRSVPEPATLALLALGLFGIGFSRSKKI